MKYTLESPEFLLAYSTLTNRLETTGNTCNLTTGCINCPFDSMDSICDPFAHLQETFNKEEFEATHPEFLL